MELHGWLKIRIHGQLRYRNFKAREISALNHILSYLCQHFWFWSCFIFKKKKKGWFQGFQVSKTGFKRIFAFPKHKLKFHFFKSSHISILSAPIYFSFTLIGIPLRQPRGKSSWHGGGKVQSLFFYLFSGLHNNTEINWAWRQCKSYFPIYLLSLLVACLKKSHMMSHRMVRFFLK